MQTKSDENGNWKIKAACYKLLLRLIHFAESDFILLTTFIIHIQYNFAGAGFLLIREIEITDIIEITESYTRLFSIVAVAYLGSCKGGGRRGRPNGVVKWGCRKERL